MIKILLGWFFWATNRNNDLARKRLKICARCPERSWFVCSICGCVLQPKARLKEDYCPLNKW